MKEEEFEKQEEWSEEAQERYNELEKDLSVDGPGSPASIKKIREYVLSRTNAEGKKIFALIDNAQIGFAKDDPNVTYITFDKCREQTTWFRKEFFKPGDHVVPAWLYRYLHFMFVGGDWKYKSKDEVVKEAQTDLKKFMESDDYKKVVNIIKYSDTNKAAEHMIGFIMLVAGSMQVAAKNKAYISFMLENPEAYLHPQQDAKFMSLLYAIDDDYGGKGYQPEKQVVFG